MIFNLPQNVVGINGTTPEIHNEKLFFFRLFLKLQEVMGNSFNDWSFTIHVRQRGEIKGSDINLYRAHRKRNALLLLADERERFPIEATTGFDVVFRQYLNHSDFDTRFHAFPVGYLDAVGMIEPVIFAERTVPLFFSGYLNRNRVDFFKQFRKTWWLPRHNLPGRYSRELARRMVEKFTKERDFSDYYARSIISFSEGFAKGMPSSEYAATLANSQIAICPTGFISAETIRHWEAMRLGCVIITDPLPDNCFYRDSPMIVLKDWSQLHHTITGLMANQEELIQRHQATVDWWNGRCSEQAVVNYMLHVMQP